MSAARAFFVGMATGAFTAGVVIIFVVATLLTDRWRR